MEYINKNAQGSQWSREPGLRMRSPGQRLRMQKTADRIGNIDAVQRKEDEEQTAKGALPHVADEMKHSGDPKSDHPYMKVLGWGRSKNWTIFGTQYTTRFIYRGTASDWKKLLADLDSDRAVNNYLVPFFAAAGCGGGSVRHNIYATDYTEDYEYKEATPSESDILELLKALYDTDSSGKSTLDLPNEFWEGGSNVPRFYDAGFDGLASFISKYQTLLIHEKSKGFDSSTGEDIGEALNYGDVKKLATEGTRWSDVQINNPRVVNAMVNNAFATAIAAAKAVVRLKDEYVAEDKDSGQNQAISMVKNSALIMKSAIDSYGGLISTTNKNIASVFDTAWSLIPLPTGITGEAAKITYKALSGVLTKDFKVGGDYKHTKQLKGDFVEKYRNIIGFLADQEGLNMFYKSALQNSFESSLGS